MADHNNSAGLLQYSLNIYVPASLKAGENSLGYEYFLFIEFLKFYIGTIG